MSMITPELMEPLRLTLSGEERSDLLLLLHDQAVNKGKRWANDLYYRIANPPGAGRPPLLSEAQVADIVEKRRRGYKLRLIAGQYNISMKHVSYLARQHGVTRDDVKKAATKRKLTRKVLHK